MIASIIKNTFKNEFRNRGVVFLAVMSFVIITIGLLAINFLMKNYVHEDSSALIATYILDAVYTTTTVWTSIVGLILGINCVRNDISSGTLPLILSMPIRRRDYLIGRILGAWLMCLCFFLFTFSYSTMGLSIMVSDFVFSSKFIFTFFLSSFSLLFSIFLGVMLSTKFSRLPTFIFVLFLGAVNGYSSAYVYNVGIGEVFKDFNIINAIALGFYAFLPHTNVIGIFESNIRQGNLENIETLFYHLAHFGVSLALIFFIFNYFFSKKSI
ncbi:ABC transporter permease subunit [Halobacteriovorax sp. GB3]|uniref:ABC transporter permease n=1 Tax=Halobacteriovorax sp. GB3 TaxID=2719615 RepID=UPI00236132B9|nr:ABC transporter permease subunit [Halobacteriovorax sp. GB3]MDD0853438.1 ABC transporter permease subunit [Halobacteriovorax sp. GB3]